MTENIVIKQLTEDSKYFSTVYQHLESSDFQDIACRQIFKYINEVYVSYNKSPNLQEIELYVDTKELGISEKTIIRTKLQELKNPSDIDKNILIDSTEKWLKNGRFYERVTLEGAKVLDGQSKLTTEDLQKRAEEINKISFKSNAGLDYIRDAEKNFLEYQEVQAGGIKSPLNIVNIATADGHKPGTLNLYASVSNGGKTVLLINEAASAMLQGKNVAYFTFEETELEIRERLDACLFDKSTSEFKDLGPSLKSSFDMLINKGIGNCKIKAYGPRSASNLTVKSQLEEWGLKENFKADVIIGDSITIMKPIGKSDGQSYSVGKAVSEEAKALCIELGVPYISAVQFGRGVYGSGEVGMEDVAESIAIAQIATTMIGVVLDEHRPDTRLLSIIKSRKVNKSKIKAERININTDKQKVWDMTDNEKRPYIKSEEKEQLNFMNNIVETAEKVETSGSSALDSLFNR